MAPSVKIRRKIYKKCAKSTAGANFIGAIFALSAFGASAYYIYAGYFVSLGVIFYQIWCGRDFWLCGVKYRSDIWRFASVFCDFSAYKDYKFMKILRRV